MLKDLSHPFTGAYISTLPRKLGVLNGRPLTRMMWIFLKVHKQTYLSCIHIRARWPTFLWFRVDREYILYSTLYSVYNTANQPGNLESILDLSCSHLSTHQLSGLMASLTWLNLLPGSWSNYFSVCRCFWRSRTSWGKHKISGLGWKLGHQKIIQPSGTFSRAQWQEEFGILVVIIIFLMFLNHAGISENALWVLYLFHCLASSMTSVKTFCAQDRSCSLTPPLQSVVVTRQ